MQKNGNKSVTSVLPRAKETRPSSRNSALKTREGYSLPNNLTKLHPCEKGPIETDRLEDVEAQRSLIPSNNGRKSRFINGTGSWTDYRTLGDHYEINFHDGKYPDGKYIPFWDRIRDFYERTEEALNLAYEEGVPYIIFMHGSSTSGPFRVTARSVVRNIMRDKKSTPFIIKCKSIQHDTVFVAAIRPKKK